MTGSIQALACEMVMMSLVDFSPTKRIV